ncbi:MAG: hypothetical protein CVT59_07980 [Actinobacteria bacterium HGW-Actinobacteria-1]|nr:MAG: hypothetical protein CVT59_07980 [Actinobacteria bacterium HGW-Actinobacteria-1]
MQTRAVTLFRALRFTVLLTIVACIALIATPALAATPSISGRVTSDIPGTPLPDIAVTLLRLDAPDGEIIESQWATTDADGQYVLVDVAPGEYAVLFDDPTGSYVSEAYNNRSVFEDWDVIEVADVPVTGIDAVLTTARHISGTVAASDGSSTEGVEVTAWLFDVNWYMWLPVRSAAVATDGTYAIGGLPRGTYRLEFADPDGQFARQFYLNALSIETATNVSLTTVYAVSDRNITLEPAAHITGRVLDAVGENGVPCAWITAWQYDAGAGEWTPVEWAESDESGMYSVDGLSAGTYRISAFDVDGAYVERYFPSTRHIDDATSITVAAGETRADTDIILATASHISGTVTAEIGTAPLPDIEVTAYAYDADYEDWWPVSFATTGADGAYSIGGLEGGTYRVEFWDPNEVFVDEFYDNAKDGVLSATDVTVAAAGVQTGVDAALTRRGEIAGTTTLKMSGAAVAGVEVTLYGSDFGDWYEWDTTTSDANGHFAFPHLFAGAYRLGFHDPSGKLPDQYYSGVTSFTSGTSITVRDATTTTVTAQLIGSKGAITGVVRDSVTRSPLSNIGVSLESALNVGAVLATTTTDASGTYRFNEVPSGFYVVRFTDGAGTYATQFYPSTPWGWELSSRVTASIDTVSRADSDMKRAGRISGRVVSKATGTAIAGIQVQVAWMLSPQYPVVMLPVTTTAADGTYSLGGLYPGTYHVVFSDPAADWGTQAYNGITPEETLEFYVGSNVTVAAGNTTPSINGALTARLAIKCAVSVEGDSFEPEASVFLWALTADGWVCRGGGNGRDGKMEFGNLTPGRYRVGFISPPTTGIASEFYSGWPTLEGATDIVLTDRPVSITCDVGRPCSFNGTVTSTDSGDPLAGARIDFYRYNNQAATWLVSASTTTTTDGTYTKSGLLKGEYRVEVVPADGFVSEFNGDQPTAQRAEGITLGYGESATVDFGVGAAVTPARSSGPTRFETAVAVAKNAFPDWTGVTDVIIASGEDRSIPDPLSAAGLAWTYDAPLLLVRGTSLPSAVTDAIDAMPDGVCVHVVGGPAAVSTECETALRAIDGVAEVTRTAGPNRYATAAAVAREMKRERGDEMADFALVANGSNPKNFVDALSLSPLAAAQGAPILLVASDAVPTDTRAVLSDLDPSKIYLAGGPAAVSEQVRSTLDAERWSGADRYATAVAISRESVSRGWLNYSLVGVTSSLPDALAGGCTVGLDGGVMLLTKQDSLPSATANALHEMRLEVTECRVFGGAAAISETTLDMIRNALR